MPSNSRGFTLIEVLIVTVIIGILAAVAIPKFSNTKYYYDNATYTSDQAALNYTESTGVTATIAITAGPPVGFSATSFHTGTPETCAIYVTTAPVAPATSEGVPKCT